MRKRGICMKAIAINGSPRKNGKTTVLLEKVLQGLRTKGASTELINLYDKSYKGCISCFACKKSNNKCNGVCGYIDGLTPVLKKIMESDYLILGMPVLVGSVNGYVRAFLERLIFPNLSYKNGKPVYTGKIKFSFVLTMDVGNNQADYSDYRAIFSHNHYLINLLSPKSAVLVSFNSKKFKNYSDFHKQVLEADFDNDNTSETEEFKNDCSKAYEVGVLAAKEFMLKEK